MRSFSIRRATSVASMLLCSCGGAPETPLVTAPPKPPPPLAVKPASARWVIGPDASAPTLAELAIADARLLVGEGGQRFLVRNGKTTSADTVLPESIGDVSRTPDGRFLFLGRSGATYMARDPLGPIESKMAAPTAKTVAVAAGKRALFVLDDKGALHRSIDDGASWKPITIDWPSGARASHLAATRKGEVLLVAIPQRTVASIDDGATFQSIATPSIGVAGVVRSTDDAAILVGRTQWAALRVSPTRLEIAGKPTLPALTKKSSPDDDVEILDRLVGERHVVVRMTAGKGDTRVIEASIAPLAGEAPLKKIVELTTWPLFVEVAGWGSTVVIALGSKTNTRLMRTQDEGGSWEALDLAGTFEHPYVRRLFVGPAVLLLSRYCTGGPHSCGTHLFAQGAWRKLDGFDRTIDEVSWDVARNRVVWVEDRRTLFTAKLDFSTLQHLAELKSVESMSVDDAGIVHVIDSGYARALGLDGKPTMESMLPFADVSLSLAGRRGLAVSRLAHQGFETDDGGEHWSKVAVPNRDSVKCAANGCLVGGAERVGWDLPSSTHEQVTTRFEPEIPPDPPEPVPSKSELPSKAVLRCTATGKWASITGYASVGDSPIAWLATESALGHFATWAKGGTIARATLFEDPTKVTKKKAAKPAGDPETSDRTSRTMIVGSSARGVVAARFSFEYAPKGSGKKNPVDVEIAWADFATGKVHRAKIPAVAPFRIGSYNAEATFSVLPDHRLLFMSSGAAPLYFIDTSGKIETWSRPKNFANTDFFHAWLDGKKLTLVRYDRDVLIAESSDGNTWTERVWTIADQTTVHRVGGKAYVRTGRIDVMPDRLFALEGLPLDPPSPIPVTTHAPAITACSASQLDGLEVIDQLEGPLLELKVDGKSTTLPIQDARRNVGPTGSGCVSSLKWSSTSDGDNLQAITFPHDPTHGWAFLTTNSGSEARPITCTEVK